ncbi:ubiquitin-protein transferase activating protein [Homalodisca vitripennis]|nr:ubiquitin-protein transferase activating protein [Homalodisca vitripennis]
MDLNLIDWSANNVLAVALGSSVYLWNATTGNIDQLMELEGTDYVCSLSWIQEGNMLAVGTFQGPVQRRARPFRNWNRPDRNLPRDSSSSMRSVLILLLRCRLYLVNRGVASSFHGPLQFREQEKVTGGQIWGIQWLRYH